jgi:hypothetical protein
MAIYEHYYEALEVMGELFNFIFDGINDRFQHELQLISQQYPFEPIEYLRPPLRITYQEGITMLKVNFVFAFFIYYLINYLSLVYFLHLCLFISLSFTLSISLTHYDNIYIYLYI